MSDGAKNQLWAATTPKEQIKSGEYYIPIGTLNAGSAYSRDERMAEELWNWTEGVLKKHGFS
jgi:hypothetical protein